MINLQIVNGAMSLLAKGQACAEVSALGISKEEWKVATGHHPWLGSDRTRVRKVLDALTYGTMDIIGIPRIDVPAEYHAAVITMFVAPMNMQVACRWLEHSASAEIIALDGAGADKDVDPSQLFAMVSQAYADGEVGNYQQVFTKRTGLALQAAKDAGSSK